MSAELIARVRWFAESLSRRSVDARVDVELMMSKATAGRMSRDLQELTTAVETLTAERDAARHALANADIEADLSDADADGVIAGLRAEFADAVTGYGAADDVARTWNAALDRAINIIREAK